MSVRGFVRRRWVPLAAAVAAVAAFFPLRNYLAGFRSPDVPFVVTPHDVVGRMLDLAEVGRDDTVLDLGSGDGRILVAAAGRGAKAVGVEIDPELVDRSREAVRAAGLADRVTVRRGDLFKQDLSPATVVTMFLKPDLLERLIPQLRRLPAGTRVVSHWYRLPGQKPTREVEHPSAESHIAHPIYLYVTPLMKADKPPPPTAPTGR